MTTATRSSDKPAAKVLRTTRGTCPVCIEMVDARVIVDEGKVFLEKECPDHGIKRAFLSNHPRYYGELMEAFFELMPESYPQRDYILRLTARCNMQCPICLASADDYQERDLTLEEAREFIDQPRRLKLDLMGAEPTLWPDLETLIRESKAKGHINALHSNGIRLLDEEYLKRLVDAGMDEVHLQFDGFEDEHDAVLRGQPMSAKRMKILETLEKHDVATDLVVVVARGLNENQMEPVLDYAAEHTFVKEVFYLGCRPLGRASDDYADQVVAPDETIDDLEDATGGRVNREDVRVFNKLYFAALATMKVRKCFYIHHYMVLRDRGGYRPISDYIDLPFLEPHLDRFRKLLPRSRAVAIPYLGLAGSVAVARKNGYVLFLEGLRLAGMLKLGFDLSQMEPRTILLGFITACDPWIHDEQISANCGKGEVATDIGIHESGADANVDREKFHLRIQAKKAAEKAKAAARKAKKAAGGARKAAGRARRAVSTARKRKTPATKRAKGSKRASG